MDLPEEEEEQKIFGPIAGFGSVIGLKKLIDKFTEED